MPMGRSMDTMINCVFAQSLYRFRAEACSLPKTVVSGIPALMTNRRSVIPPRGLLFNPRGALGAGGNPVLDPVMRAEADLEFQDLNIVQQCFTVLSLASCLVRPVHAPYQNDGISFHVLAKSVLLLTGKPLCVLNHLEDQPVHILEDVQVVRERHCRYMDKGASLPPCPPEDVTSIRRVYSPEHVSPSHPFVQDARGTSEGCSPPF